MKFPSLLQSVAILCLLLACHPAVLAQNNSNKKSASLEDLPAFSATEIRGSIKWKIYHSGSQFRVEPSSAMATVFVPKKDKVYNLLIFPEKTNCVVMKTAQAKMMRSPLELVYGSNSAITRTASHEVVDGHPCTILEAVTTSTDGTDFKSKIWAADDLKGVPLRIDVYAETGIVTSNFHDVVVGAVEPALFRMPGNCIPPEKTYQVAPKNSDPGKPPAGQKAPESKPQ